MGLRLLCVWGMMAFFGHALIGQAYAGQPFSLGFPLECKLGETCFVQNYVDHELGSGYRDFHCGAMTYDGHDGTDFRIASMAEERAGVAVLAAANGVVKRVRDGVPDALMTAATKAEVAGEECGNGVIIDHGDGWQTQYCHLRRGSVALAAGRKVKRGQMIGLIGLSGATEFPHLHLTVRHKDEVVDPFAPTLAVEACSEQQSAALFDDRNQNYQYRDRIVLNFGFADGPVQTSEIEAGEMAARVPDRASGVIVAYVRVMGLNQGDVQTVSIIGPDGEVIAERAFDPLDRPKAQNVLFVGGKRPKEGWKAGIYSALYSVHHGEKGTFDKWFFLKF